MFPQVKAPNQKLIVRSNDIYDYYVQKGDLKLYVDPLYKRGEHKIICAEVVAVPDALEDWCRIVPEVQVGDKAYFHYNALREEGAIPGLQGLFTIEYDFVFAVVRQERIVMIGGKILAEPIFDEGVVDIEIDGGTIKGKMTPSGIVTEINSGPKLSVARLAHIGQPLKGEELPDIAIGDTFVYINNADFRRIVEGHQYFLMDQEDILVKQV
jgi:co-chaperonin GroES (HSP10)